MLETLDIMEKYTIEKIDETTATLTIFEKKYSIQSSGIIINPKGLYMKGEDNGRGYKSVLLQKGITNQKRIYIHRLVAKAFIPNPDNKPQVNHIDGNKANNKVENLEWVNQLENNRHAWKIGLCKDITKERKKRVVQKDTDGNILKIWESCEDAARHYSCTGELISMAARKVCITGKGFVWEYENKNIENSAVIINGYVI